MKNKKAGMKLLIMLGCLLLLVFSGCGKKGPPIPPEIKGQSIAAPFDIKYTKGDKELLLSWKHEMDAQTAFVKPQGFEIFMAKKTFKACVGCPLEFKAIGFVSPPSMAFGIKIEKGYKYYFRVQAVGDDNMRSEYSKTIQFENK